MGKEQVAVKGGEAEIDSMKSCRVLQQIGVLIRTN
jgi:hypothetical protein